VVFFDETVHVRLSDALALQMLRGAEMLFSAGLSVTFLKRKLTKWHNSGIACCLAGITLVGASSLLSSQQAPDSEPVLVLVGMMLIVIAQVSPAALYLE
jgi:drug/metabolite transporter (DMT)-like permease